MAEKYYSWSSFPRSDQHNRDMIKVGDEVSRGDFEDLDDDQFQELIDVGAIRTTPYPIPLDEDTGRPTFEGSPREFALQQVAEMDADQLGAAVQQAHIDPHLNLRNKEAMEANDYDETVKADEADEKAREQDSAEKGQETRKALEGRRGVEGAAGARPKAGR